MAKFCNQCGRPLQEGEVCTCQQQAPVNAGQVVQPNPGQVPPNHNQGAGQVPPNYNQGAGQVPPNYNQGAGQVPPNYNQGQPQMSQVGAAAGQMADQFVKSGKNVFQKLVDMFKNPIGTVESTANENSIVSPIAMVIFNIAVCFLIAVIAMIAVRVKLGDYASYVKLPYVRIVLVAIIFSALYDFGLPGAMYLSNKVFFKEDTTYAKMLSIVGCKVLLDSVFIAAGCILAVLSPYLGLIVILLGNVLTMGIYYLGYQKVSKLADTQKVYSVFIAQAMYFIVAGILYYAIIWSIISKFQYALGSLF